MQKLHSPAKFATLHIFILRKKICIIFEPNFTTFRDQTLQLCYFNDPLSSYSDRFCSSCLDQSLTERT